MILLGSGRDQLGSRRDQLRIEVILLGSAEDRRGRRRGAGVVVELSIRPVPLRRAAEDVVEPGFVVEVSPLSAVLPRAAVDVVVPRCRRRTVTGRSTRRNSRWED